MTYLVVVDTTPDKKIAKMQEYPTRAEADAHVERVKNKYPNAFVIDNPVPYKQAYTTVNLVDKTIIYDSATDTADREMRVWKYSISKFGMSRQMENHIKDHHAGVAGNDYDQTIYDSKIKLRGERP